MITVIETSNGVFAPIFGNPTVASLNAETRAPLQVILHGSWSAQDRAEYGIYLVQSFVVPNGKVPVGNPSYARVDGQVVETYTVADPPPPSAGETRITAFTAQSDRADLLNRLRTATPAQIETWLTSNMTNIAQARAIMAAVIKHLVVVYR